MHTKWTEERFQEIFAAVSGDLLGGAGKTEHAKLPGAGAIPKPCPMQKLYPYVITCRSPNIEDSKRLRKSEIVEDLTTPTSCVTLMLCQTTIRYRADIFAGAGTSSRNVEFSVGHGSFLCELDRAN
jgi:hypothetical protein